MCFKYIVAITAICITPVTPAAGGAAVKPLTWLIMYDFQILVKLVERTPTGAPFTYAAVPYDDVEPIGTTVGLKLIHEILFNKPIFPPV